MGPRARLDGTAAFILVVAAASSFQGSGKNDLMVPDQARSYAVPLFEIKAGRPRSRANSPRESHPDNNERHSNRNGDE